MIEKSGIDRSQTGVVDPRGLMSVLFLQLSPMIPGHLSRSTSLSSMVLQLAESILANGLVRLLQQDASSRSCLRLTCVYTDQDRALMENQEQSDLRIYVNCDGADVDEQLFMDIAKPDRTTFHPTLVLLGTRLGLDKITPAYWDSLKSTLQMPQSIGIAGWVTSQHDKLVKVKLILCVVDVLHHHTILLGRMGTFCFTLILTIPDLPFPTRMLQNL